MNFITCMYLCGFPRWCSGKESTCQCRRHKRCRVYLWIWKIPWSRRCQPTTVFLPGKFYGQRSLAGCSIWDCKELDTTEWLTTHTHTCICVAITTLRIQNSSITATPKLPWTFPVPDLFSITIVLSFLSCHKNGTIQYVTLCDKMSLRFMQGVPWINTLLFFIVEYYSAV